jgi:hypothetical protein
LRSEKLTLVSPAHSQIPVIEKSGSKLPHSKLAWVKLGKPAL